MEAKKIIITAELRREMMDKFGVAPHTLINALNFATQTALSRVLREYALEHGGELWRRVESPEKGGEA